MAKYRDSGMSYHRYRGRAPKWKMAVGAVLVLVIACSGALLMMQRYLFFDDSGHARLELPSWGTGTPDTGEVEVPELEIQEPERTKLRLRLLADTPLTMEAWTAAQALETGLDGAAVTLRDYGTVYFDSETAAYAAMSPAADTMEALRALTAATNHAVGLFDCFPDPRASQKHLDDMGLKNTGGYVFYDGQNRNYLDPAKPAAVDYLSRLLTETAALGFDEVVLRGFTFPTEGKLTKIAYTETMTRTEALTAALKAFRAALDQAGYESVGLSVELTAEQILAGEDQVAGLSLAQLSETAGAIYAVTTPEQIPALEAAVQAAGTARFVPMLETLPEDADQLSGFLLLPQ